MWAQAYEDFQKKSLNIHYLPSEHGTPRQVSDFHLTAYPAEHRQTVKATFQGKLVKIEIKGITDQKTRRVIRGCVSDFSPQSRARLFDLFHALDVKKKPVFLTLTYGEDYPDARTAKNHLRAFLERIRRLVSRNGTSAIWRMEFQERGAPHFHIVFFDLPFIKKENIQAMWGEIIGQDAPFTRIELIRRWNGLMFYVSKYVAKVDDGGEGGSILRDFHADKLLTDEEKELVLSGFISPTYLHAYRKKYGDAIGRVWGTFNKQFLPFAEKITREIAYNLSEFMAFRAVAERKYPPIENYLSPGFRLYVDDAEQWADIFSHFCDRKF